VVLASLPIPPLITPLDTLFLRLVDSSASAPEQVAYPVMMTYDDGRAHRSVETSSRLCHLLLPWWSRHARFDCLPALPLPVVPKQTVLPLAQDYVRVGHANTLCHDGAATPAAGRIRREPVIINFRLVGLPRASVVPSAGWQLPDWPVCLALPSKRRSARCGRSLAPLKEPLPASLREAAVAARRRLAPSTNIRPILLFRTAACFLRD
jgi:hypothetical protein